ADAGTQIGLRLRGQADELRRLHHVEAKTPWPEQRAAFQRGDRIVRFVDAKTPLAADLDPAGAYRRCLLGELLVGQAERVWHEHWYDEKPAAEPYYRVVGRGFLAEAQGLTRTGLGDSAAMPTGWAAVVKTTEAKVTGPGELALIDTTGRPTDE